MTEQLFTLAAQFGTPGFLIAFMIWDRTQQNKLIKERTEADLQMARALTMLTAKVENVRAL